MRDLVFVWATEIRLYGMSLGWILKSLVLKFRLWIFTISTYKLKMSLMMENGTLINYTQVSLVMPLMRFSTFPLYYTMMYLICLFGQITLMVVIRLKKATSGCLRGVSLCLCKTILCQGIGFGNWLVLKKSNSSYGLLAMIHCQLCQLCTKEVCPQLAPASVVTDNEDILHCFRDCTISRQLWRSLKVTNASCFGEMNHHLWLKNGATGPDSCAFQAAIWWIWRARNTITLAGEEFPLYRYK